MIPASVPAEEGEDGLRGVAATMECPRTDPWTHGTSMTPKCFTNALILTGPTASGKSALGRRGGGAPGWEIVSMDSMALYRGMDVGTAKPNADGAVECRTT